MIAGEADALPLLAFVLERLMRENAAEETIDIAQLERTGGVAAAIEAAATVALEDAGVAGDIVAQRTTLRRLFIPPLARIDRETKTVQRRTAQRADLPRDLLGVANALTKRRLLVTKLVADGDRSAEPGGGTLEVAHEALLRRWPMLVELLSEDRDALLLLDGVLAASADFKNAPAGREADFLIHRGSHLAEGLALAHRGEEWARLVDPALD